ncbi:MAG: hypothetical protein ABEJ06_06345 [Haloarculaceae archaeon]
MDPITGYRRRDARKRRTGLVREKVYEAVCGRVTWMRDATTPLDETARSIFTDLGYTVTENGSELLAERKWRTVRVTTADPCDAPEHGALRCFVAEEERAHDVCEELLETKPDYDWAVLGVDDAGEYEVYHPDADVVERLPA